MHALLLAISLLPLQQQALPKPAADVDPAAAKALEAMVKTYHSIGKLHQQSVYSAGEDRRPPLVRSRLVLSRPNKIVLEMIQNAVDREQPYRILYQSDGKDMYAYQETKGFYVKEKAPKNLKELDYLAVSIEMGAITGGDPIPPLLAQSKSVKMGEPLLADTVMCDVLIFDMGSPERKVEMRLTIGQKDHLLRKFEYATTPIPKPETEEQKVRIVVGDPNAPENQPPKPEQPTRLAYENQVFLKDLPKDAFLWIAPAGSFAYQDYPSLLNPHAGAGQRAPTAGVVIPNGQKRDPKVKIVPFEELMKKAWKKK